MKKLTSVSLLWYLVLFLGASLPHEIKLELPRDPVTTIYRKREPEKTLVPPRREVPPEFRALFDTAAGSAGIPPGVLESIAFTESGFNPAALSPARADGFRDHGMFQFNGKYLAWYKAAYGDFDPMDPDEAAHVAAQHLRFLYDRYGHWPAVCLAYNAGIGAVDSNKIPENSHRYLIKIYEEGGRSMKAEDVYALVASGDLPRSAAIGVIRAYGNREVIEALEQARKVATPVSAPSLLDAEIDARLTGCLRRLDEFIDTTMTAMRGKA